MQVRAEMHGIRGDLRTETQTGNEETRRFMRVLHEDTISRIAAIGEGKRRR